MRTSSTGESAWARLPREARHRGSPLLLATSEMPRGPLGSAWPWQDAVCSSVHPCIVHTCICPCTRASVQLCIVYPCTHASVRASVHPPLPPPTAPVQLHPPEVPEMQPGPYRLAGNSLGSPRSQGSTGWQQV